MDSKTFFVKKILITYFLVVAGITAATGIIGVIFAPDTTFGYEAFLSPFLFGFVGVLPSLVTYSKKELSAKQMFFRLVIHFMLLELLILLFASFTGLITSPDIAISLALSVLIIYLTVQLVMWFNDKRAATEMNTALKVLQSEK